MITRCLTLVLVLSAVGCKKDKKKSEPGDNTSNTAATTTPPSTTSAPGAPAIAMDAAPKAPDAAVAKKAEGPRAYLKQGGKLLEVSGDGAVKDLGPFQDPGWCEVDAQAQVVWSLGPSGLQAMDLSDGTMHTVIAPGPGLDDVEIRYPVGVPVGVVDGLQTDTALIVNVSKSPNTRAEVVCDGDRQYYCYEDMESEDESKWVLIQEAKDSLARYKTFKIADRDFLVALAARSTTRGSGQIEIETPAAPKVEISKHNCREAPEDCGTGSYVGGQRFWSIITENDRGDYYHEARQLYDATKKEFVDLDAGTRSKTPFAEGGSASLSLSRDRAYAMTFGGTLVDLAHARVIKEFKDAKPCGWR